MKKDFNEVPSNDSLLKISEDYISERIIWKPFSDNLYRRRLDVLHFEELEIDKIIKELEIDSNKELTKSTNPKKALGFILGASCLTLLLVVAVIMNQLNLFIIGFLPTFIDVALLASIGAVMIGYRDYKSIKKRMEFRNNKYQNWSVSSAN